MDYSSSVPPGFRFHPTEEELVGYYLNRKINSLKIDLDVIVEIDLYRIEPWDIQDRCKYGYEEQNEWYFFSHKDKKYPTGTRMNRATAAGFWKATGRDKAVLSNNRMIGMRKTLVYYKGRAPNGQKSDWIMHEYRLQTSQLAPLQEQGWVVCRAFKKPAPNQNQRFGGWSTSQAAHAHYQPRDNYNNNYKPPSYSEIPSSSNTMLMNYPNQISPYSPSNSEQDHLYPSSTDTLNHLTECPKQESRSINDGPEYMQHGSFNQEPFHEDDTRNVEDSCVDWNSFDELLMESHSLSQPNYQLNASNISSHLFTNFPDL